MAKKSLEKYLLIGIGSILLVIFITLFSVFLITNKPAIAFYKVSDSVIQNTLKIANDNNSSKKKYSPIILDSGKPLSEQKKDLKKAVLLIAENDCDVTEFAMNSTKVSTLSAAYLNGMPSTVSGTVPKRKNTIFYLPLLYDFYQIDVNYQLYVESKIKNIDYWSDFIKMSLTEVNKVQYPIVLGGNQSEDFLNLFGMQIESLYSYKEYDEILDALYQAWKKDYSQKDEKFPYKNVYMILEKYSEEGSILYQVSKLYSDLLKKNLINQEQLKNDLITSTFYADNNLCGNLFTTLSQHRNIDRKVANNFKSIYCPSYKENLERKFVAPEICGILLNGNKKTLNLLLDLSSKKQTEFSTVTGLAPVQKNCQVADHQADDVRYWIAASKGPLKPLSAALPENQAVSFVNNYLINLVIEQ